MKLKKIYYMVIPYLFIMMANANKVFATGIFDLGDPLAQTHTGADLTEAATELGNFYKFAMVSVNGLAGFGLMTSVLAFAVNAFKFAKAGAMGSPKERAEAVSNLLTIAITTAILGSLPLFIWAFCLISGIKK